MTDAIEEKRVYDDRAGARTVVVGADRGLAAVRVSGDRVGGVELLVSCTPRAVAAGGGRVAAATEEDVLLAPDDGTGGFDPLGFGPAVAVGFHDGVVAAGPTGRVARYRAGTWTALGTLDSVAAIDGDLIATAGGLHRVASGLPGVGLAAVRDVTTAGGQPLAAAADGLYALANGWQRRIEGDFRVVAAAPARASGGGSGPADGDAGGGDGRAHAATADTLYARTGTNGWRAVELPVDGRVADVAYPDEPCVATVDGTLAVAGPTGWRSYPVGLAGVVGLVATENAFDPSG